MLVHKGREAACNTELLLRGVLVLRPPILAVSQAAQKREEGAKLGCLRPHSDKQRFSNPHPMFLFWIPLPRALLAEECGKELGTEWQLPPPPALQG